MRIEYQIIRCIGTNGKMIPKVLVPDEAIKRFRHKIREILAPHTTSESMNAKILALNQFTRGWCQYYRCTNSPTREFSKLSQELLWGMAHWLGRKYQISMPTIMQKYRNGNTFGTKSKKMARPDEYKVIRLRQKVWHNPYTAKEEVIREKFFSYAYLWSGNEDRPGWIDLREEVISLKGTICAINGPNCESRGTPLHPSEVEIDHISPRAGFKVQTEADRMKHLQPVCTSCHRAKTKTDLKVLSRMR